MQNSYDVIILGAGAAGLMAAGLLGQGGKKVLVLDKANKVAKKILMSGGGRCNFTNLNITFDNYLSHNPHFMKSALSRYSQWDFIELVRKYNIEYYEKTLGQLFCCHKSTDIRDLLLAECQKGQVDIRLKKDVKKIKLKENKYLLETETENFLGDKLIVATGGLSIPTMGASPFGYQIAKQFSHHVWPTRAGLVPFTLQKESDIDFQSLSGVSVFCEVSCNGQTFKEDLLFTHRGLSGPAMLQISSFWQNNDVLIIKLLPNLDLKAEILMAKKDNALMQLNTFLAKHYPKRLLALFLSEKLLKKALKQLDEKDLNSIVSCLHYWQIKPNGTEGYRTAEVTLGGVDCDEVCSKSFESKKQKGLYFIGEVLDVTGHLGGYNFQWAWSSAYACATELLANSFH